MSTGGRGAAFGVAGTGGVPDAQARAPGRGDPPAHRCGRRRAPPWQRRPGEHHRLRDRRGGRGDAGDGVLDTSPTRTPCSTACTSHWAAHQRLPDVAGSASDLRTGGPREGSAPRICTGSSTRRRRCSTLTHRDRDVRPGLRPRNAVELTSQSQMDARSAVQWAPRAADQARRRALAGHALSFATWRSLCVDQALARAGRGRGHDPPRRGLLNRGTLHPGQPRARGNPVAGPAPALVRRCGGE